MKTHAVRAAFVVMVASIVTVCLLVRPSATFAEEAYVRIALRPWLSMEIPSRWQVHSDEFRGMVAALMETQSIDSSVVMTSFSASLALPEVRRTVASINVRFYPDEETDQTLIEPYADFFRGAIDELLRGELSQGLRQMTPPVSIDEWLGTEIVELGAQIAFRTSYVRTVVDLPDSTNRVSLWRVLDGARSYTMTLSCDVDFCATIDPIFVYMAESVTVGAP